METAARYYGVPPDVIPKRLRPARKPDTDDSETKNHNGRPKNQTKLTEELRIGTVMKNADASPTKDFFVRMITRDISLEDCILDLIDNCLDGARREITVESGEPLADSYKRYHVSLCVDSNGFLISDNCGGISIDNAIDYAFHFGRRPDAPSDESAIGLYGIGMKRAILKIGRKIKIYSSTKDEAFVCTIDVDDWLTHDDWEFDMDDGKLGQHAGTSIQICDLNLGVGDEFGDDTFVNSLSTMIARDYARFLGKGFEISINEARLDGYGYVLKEADDFKAYRDSYEDGDVAVEIIAGMSAAPPSDLGPSERAGDTEYYGWFVFCNDRVVLAADKSDRTVWGDEKFPRWHYQYNGFMGMVLFQSRDPNLLPWTTTKRDVDESSSVYRRAVSKMKTVTRPWIEYTNQRKADLDRARTKERTAESVSAFGVRPSTVLTVPTVVQKPKIQIANILYQKPVSEVNRVRRALGRGNMSYRSVGERTFEYFVDNEVEE